MVGFVVPFVLKGIYSFSPFQLEKAPLADSGLECRARAIPKLRGWQVFLSLMRGRRIAEMKQEIKLQILLLWLQHCLVFH